MRARSGSALVWTALVLMLLPVMLALGLDGADVVSAHQALQAALTEAWEAVGASTAPPSAAALATLTVLCREDLPPSLQLVSPVRVTNQGLTVTAAVTVSVPLGPVSRWVAVGALPIIWTTP